jgi:DNA modification methylase
VTARQGRVYRARARTGPLASSRLIHGENLSGLAELPRDSITLAYLDPPFHTGRVHLLKTTGRVAFDDRWPNLASYLAELAERLIVVRELLAPHGSCVIHVDPKTSHYVKVIADMVFGPGSFASEIIWRYRRWPSKTPNFQRVHDVLLRYRKDPRAKARWTQLYEPLAPSTLETWGTNKQRAVFDETSGRRKRSSRTSSRTRGVPMGDVWEIGILAPVSKERTGYPTQKPEALLERLITALSRPGDVVLDPYAGSGTALVVAAKMGRVFLGIDKSALAIATARRRLAAAGFPLRRFSKRSTP